MYRCTARPNPIPKLSTIGDCVMEPQLARAISTGCKRRPKNSERFWHSPSKTWTPMTLESTSVSLKIPWANPTEKSICQVSWVWWPSFPIHVHIFFLSLCSLNIRAHSRESNPANDPVDKHPDWSDEFRGISASLWRIRFRGSEAKSKKRHWFALQTIPTNYNRFFIFLTFDFKDFIITEGFFIKWSFQKIPGRRKRLDAILYLAKAKPRTLFEANGLLLPFLSILWCY